MNDLILSRPQAADRNPALVYLASLPARTGQRTQAQALRVVAGVLNDGVQDIEAIDWGALRYQHTAAIRSRLIEAYAPATAKKILSALRGTLRNAWRLGLMTADEYQRAADLERIDGETLPAGRELSAGEIQALFNACHNDSTPAGIRDAAIIAVLYVAGLRRDEVVRLEVQDFDTENGALIVRGKRSKERKAYLLNGALSAMLDWLSLRGLEPGALFLAVNKGGRIRTSKLTSQTIYNMVVKRADEADVKHFSPHDLRRTFISDLLEAGADIATVSKMAGHSDVKTTARYDRRPEEAKKKAASLLHVPYKAKP